MTLEEFLSLINFYMNATCLTEKTKQMLIDNLYKTKVTIPLYKTKGVK